jgi:surfeit locus 1 family protein
LSALRLRLFIVSAAIAAVVFIRLGVWQLHRREERRAFNALVRARLDSAEIDVDALPRDTARIRFRRVRVAGVPDYEHELVLAAQTHNGSPGVNVITPVRMPGRDTVVLVNRGWVYSPDAAAIDLPRWHDRDSVFIGYVEKLPPTGGTAFKDRPRVLSRLSSNVLATALPYPVAPLYVVAIGDSTTPANRPARLGIPPLDEGPHLSYAIQWFAFALVAVGGVVAVLAKERRAAD